MKYLMLIMISLFASMFYDDSSAEDYDKLWKQVEKEEHTQPQSAYKVVEQIYAMAKKDKREDQLIKAIIYKVKLTQTFQDKDPADYILELESEKAALKSETAIAVYSSLLGEMYANYALANAYRFNNRTDVEGKDGSGKLPFNSLEDIQRKSFDYYMESLTYNRSAKLEEIDLLLQKDKSQQLKISATTVSQFLHFRAIQHFANAANTVSLPTDAIYLSDATLFDYGYKMEEPRGEAVYNDYTRTALALFQDAKALADLSSEQQVWLEVVRLEFVHRKISLAEKDQLYKEALLKLGRKYKTAKGYEAAYVTLINVYLIEGQQSKRNLDYAESYAKAADLLTELKKNSTDSFYKKYIEYLKDRVEQNEFDVEIEKVVSLDKPSLALLQYRNIASLHYKVARLEGNDFDVFNTIHQRDQRLKMISNLTSVQEESLALQNSEDYKWHSVEFPIEGLKAGQYVLYLYDERKKNNGAFALFHVSDLAYVQIDNESINNREAYVMDRNTGVPIQDVDIEVYIQEYNSRSRVNDWKKIADLKSDKEGKFNFIGQDRNVSYKLAYKNDYLDLREHHSAYRRGNPRERKQINLFTDRAIYRPGQLIYFKGLLLNYDKGRMPSIVADEKVKVTFRDANWQEIKTTNLHTNEYGTFNGVLTIPETGLTGQWTIEVHAEGTAHSNSLRVEEYKRRKLAVDMDKLESSYSLGDTVTVTGRLKNLSGSIVSAATIKYRIERKQYRSRHYGFGYSRSNSSEQVASGVVSSSENGAFRLVFPTKKSANDFPYNYSVHLDCIDETGESIAATKNFTLSKTPFRLEVNLVEVVKPGDKNPLTIKLVNADGQGIEGKLEVNIAKVTAPSQGVKGRYWNYPELQYLDRKTFESKFPLVKYDNQTDQSLWKVEKEMERLKRENVSEAVFDEVSDLAAGVYRISIACHDGQDREVTEERYLYLIDGKTSFHPVEQLWISQQEESYSPGESCRLDLMTPYDDAKILYSIVDRNGNRTTDWKDLPEENKIEYIIKESDRGNVTFHFIMIKNGRTYQKTITLNVPWSNKEIKINYKTFRDKLEPGVDEQWELELSDESGKPLDAEMLATIYDASLDQFKQHEWLRTFFPIGSFGSNFRSLGFGSVHGQVYQDRIRHHNFHLYGYYPRLNTFGLYLNRGRGDFMAMESMADGAVMKRHKTMSRAGAPTPQSAPMSASNEESLENSVSADWVDSDVAEQTTAQSETKDFVLRENLNETVFFYPEIKVEKGKATLKFKMNEALTQWKLLLFAHNKELQYVFDKKELVTQKPLMIEPHMPRFIRQGDNIIVNAKVSNLSGEAVITRSHISILDAITNMDITSDFLPSSESISSDLDDRESTIVEWSFNIPDNHNSPVLIKIWTEGGGNSDGEQNLIPVISNRMLVTETLPMHIPAESTKMFSLAAMDKMDNSETLDNHQFSLEFNVNPTWIVVKAMPYLTANEKPSSTDMINAVYGNLIMKDILAKQPEIKKVIAQWKEEDQKSELRKNEDLKLSQLDETPWLQAAMAEEDQRAKMKLFLDDNYVSAQLDNLIGRLKQRQLSNGGFSWMQGGRDNWYVTQHILEKIGHLSKLGIDSDLGFITKRAVEYIDDRFDEYDRDKTRHNDRTLDPLTIHYLYVRSFFMEVEPSSTSKRLIDKYMKLADKQWMQYGTYQQALTALAAARLSKADLSEKIMTSLKEKMIVSDELGNYWNDQAGYYWYNNNVEKQAIMIELFSEMKEAQPTIDGLKLWLLKNKQTNSWKSTKATAVACYAFMLDNAKWFRTDERLEISLPLLEEDVAINKKELGTGYFRKDWGSDEVSAELKEVKVTNPNKHVAWGATYWQYFEDLDKIEDFKETPLKIKKDVHKVGVNNAGEVLESITEDNPLIPGDRLRIRIELQVDRPMEFIEMKDMRSSGLEPINVLSQYKWQDGLSYYESTKDLASYFYFDFLPKGNWVFEYDVKAAHVGAFSNGITQIQSMYAPEFSSHSEGVSIVVTKP